MEERISWKRRAAGVGAGLLIACLSSGLLLLLLALILYLAALDGAVLSVGVSAIYAVSCFAGGFFAGKRGRTRKFLWGLLVGILYVGMLLAVSEAAGKMTAGAGRIASAVCICLAAGMAGGMAS